MTPKLQTKTTALLLAAGVHGGPIATRSTGRSIALCLRDDLFEGDLLEGNLLEGGLLEGDLLVVFSRR